MRERIDVSEIEAQTKIRAKYLRALENEEWDLLPGPTFVKSFLRTYATALGLDSKALVEEYRLSYERPSEPPEPIAAAPRRVRMPNRPSRHNGTGGTVGHSGRPLPSRGYIALVGVVCVLIVLLIVGLLSGGGGGSKNSTSTGSSSSTAHAGHGHGRSHAAAGQNGRRTATGVISLQLKATSAVYVCLLGEHGQRLVNGRTLEAGTDTPTYRGKHFLLTLGNNAVELVIDGIPRAIPPSSTAIGYSITKAGRRTLAPGTLPTCA